MHFKEAVYYIPDTETAYELLESKKSAEHYLRPKTCIKI